MRRPDSRKGNAPVVRGAGEAGEASNLKSNRAMQGATISGRRADSIRLQAIGQIGGA